MMPAWTGVGVTYAARSSEASIISESPKSPNDGAGGDDSGDCLSAEEAAKVRTGLKFRISFFGELLAIRIQGKRSNGQSEGRKQSSTRRNFDHSQRNCRTRNGDRAWAKTNRLAVAKAQQPAGHFRGYKARGRRNYRPCQRLAEERRSGWRRLWGRTALGRPLL